MPPRIPKSPVPPTSTRPEGQASLSTLSAHLGLSMAAISRVLNGAPAAKSIPQATQERILAAARELNYRPNLLARSLRRGRSHTVGVLVPELSEGYTSSVLAGLEQTLSAAGYMFFLITHHHRFDVLAQSQQVLTERAVDGIVAVDTILHGSGPVPAVTVSCPDAHAGVINIVLNHQRAAELALTHLYDLGHREIAVIRGQQFSSDTEPRWQAIVKVMQSLGLTLHADCVVELEGDSPTERPGYEATKLLLERGPKFTAIFAFNDLAAIGAVLALGECGLRVPEDVSVVGFDDIRAASLHHPSLTTVRQPLHRMGVLAAEAVLRRIANASEPVSATPIVVEPEMVLRNSTGPRKQ